MGVADGSKVGFSVGAAVGGSVGVCVGAAVGASVGVSVGASEGASVVGGCVVGASVGVCVGAAVGASVGVCVGAVVGSAVGVAVGLEVGELLERMVGAKEGAAVGAVAGAAFAPHLPCAALSDNWVATAAVGADLCEAMALFARGGARGYRRAFALLSATRPRWQLIGGSHAQRDVFEQTLLFAAVGCGELHAARALAAERLVVRPSDGTAWFLFGSVMLRAGERERAADAFNRAFVLGVAQGPSY